MEPSSLEERKTQFLGAHSLDRVYSSGGSIQQDPNDLSRQEQERYLSF